MIISIASGKGGTGKTTIATSLALSSDSGVQLLDCDVEEPNAHIFLKPDITRSEPVSVAVPRIDKSLCNFCGRCQEICAYNAIAVLKERALVFPQLCHGCGGCMLLCPQKAITEAGREIGVVEVGTSGDVQFAQGKLHIGEMMSPPLIRAVKECINPTRTVFIDAPPGVSCPVIEAIKGSDFCLLVTEPTPFGLNDLVLAVEVLRKLKIPFGVAINRCDIADGKLEDYCKKENISVLMHIPFRKEIAFAYSKGVPLVRQLPEYKDEFIRLHDEMKKRAI
jgi:MinD superfamily P-loop ATPase